MNKAIIWRKSIHDSDYVCRCGHKLMDKGEMDVVEDTGYILCPECGYLVAKVSTVEEAVASGAMRDAEA